MSSHNNTLTMSTTAHSQGSAVSATAGGGTTPSSRSHFVFNNLRSVEKGQYVKVFSTDVLEKVHEEQLTKTASSKENTPHSVFPSMPVQPAPQLSGEIGLVEAVTFFTLGELRGDDEEEEEEPQQQYSHHQPPPGANNYYTTPQEQQQQRRNNQRGGGRGGFQQHQQQVFNSYNGGVQPHHYNSSSPQNNNNKRHSNGYNQQQHQYTHHHQHHHGGGSFHQNMMMHSHNTHHHNHYPQQHQHRSKQQHPSDSSLPSTVIKEVTIRARSGFSVGTPLENIRRAYLVVLDLNGILGARDKGIFVPRPNLNTFLKFIFEHFVVAVWTSGIKKNADQIIGEIFGPQRNYGVDYVKKLLFSWDREQTTKNPTPEKPYGTIKELSKIFEKFPESFHAANTIIVDDSPEKCTHPSLSLCPMAFTDEVARVWQEQVIGQGDTSIANTPILLGSNNSGTLRRQQSQCTPAAGGSTFPTSPQQAAIQRRQSSIQMASSTKYVHFDDQEERGLQYVQRVLERVLVEDTLSPVYEAAEERLEEAYRDRKAASNSKDNTPNSLAQKETTLEQLQRMMQEARAQKVEATVATRTTTSIPQPPSNSFATHTTATNDYQQKQPSPLSVSHVAATAAAVTLSTATRSTHVLSSVGGLRCAGDNSDSDDEFYDQMIVE